MEQAERLGLSVDRQRIFKDNNRSAWQRRRKRPGWDALLKGMEEGAYRHVIVYHADRLMRQPHDLERLLSIADDRSIILHGQANRRDLSSAEDRFILRIEVAQACKSSDDTSRRVRDALADRKESGKPHTGRRQFGYAKGGMKVVEEEARIVRDIFRMYLEGKTPAKIARHINEQGFRTSMGNVWQAGTVRHLLQSKRVAGILRVEGSRVVMGAWPAIIDMGQWREVQERRTTRSRQEKVRCKAKRFYTARGVVMCTCGTRMGGSSCSGSFIYRCNRTPRNGERRCSRNINAEALEGVLSEVAIRVLERLDVSG